eukprot:scaffold1298_cov152-Skeletonema_menzelii.AAC.7
MPKANSQLSDAEKKAKKQLKAELKYQRKVQKLKTRIQHAISRNDPMVEQSARIELDELLRNNDILHDQRQQERACNDEQSGESMKLVRDIFHRLLSEWDNQDQSFGKAEQNKRAKDLLQHMTKGTQALTMFQDVTALRGYTRQKFYSRAGLIVESLGKLSPEQSSLSNQKNVIDACWKKLEKINRVCSIGCGPGCDAVGLLAFLRGYVPNHNVNSSSMHFVLLDYAIEEWKDAVLDDLEPILTQSFASLVTCEHCDVTTPLLEKHVHLIATTDIFLTSYLLTETRDKWFAYFIELVDKAKEGAVFYFAEPLPWQLHRLIRMSAPESDPSPLQKLRFAWIDSSMNYPELQELDGRAGGPAILLAIKV